jgi:hypothetical protein
MAHLVPDFNARRPWHPAAPIVWDAARLGWDATATRPLCHRRVMDRDRLVT